MNLQVSVWGGGAQNNQAAPIYDDTFIKAELATLKEQVEKLLATRKEFQTAYIARAAFPEVPANGKYLTIPFKRPFSKRPMVKVVLDIQDSSVRLTYQANATVNGFDIATNYAGSLNGLWYEAYIID